jgi:hypothetical protein
MRFRLIHLLDTCTPLGVAGLEGRLHRAGLDASKIEAATSHITLLARARDHPKT